MPEGKNKAEIEATQAQIEQLQSKLQELQQDEFGIDEKEIERLVGEI